MTKPKQPRKYDTYVYYLPELNILAESGSDKRTTFVVYIHSIKDHVPFDAILLGEL